MGKALVPLVEGFKRRKDHPGPVIISGYESEIYNDMLQDWYKDSINSQAEQGKPRTETIWMNYEPIQQLELF